MALTGIVVNFVYLLMMVLMWKTLFIFSKGTIGGFVYRDFVIYYICSMLIVLFFNSIENRFASDVNNGNLVTYLIRNVNPMIVYYFNSLGYGVFEIIPIFLTFIICSIVWGYFTIINFILFLIFLLIAIILTAIIRSLFSLTAVKTERVNGIMGTFFLILSFLSGSWIPLNLFPELAQKIFYFLPFQYMRYFPAVVFLGKVNYSQIIFGLLISILWIILLYFLFKILYKKAIKVFEGQGG